MSRKLVNELTWSVSRDALFKRCRRAYYYTYYGSWGGWESDADPRTRQLYILKNMSNLPMWAGGIVHQVIADTLKNYSIKASPIRTGELQARARQKLRDGWVEAIRGEWRKSPKKTNLFELYYGNGKTLPAEQTEACKERVNDCLAAFARSPILSEILAVSYVNWRPIDKLGFFLLDGELKVWCAIDFAFSDPVGRLRILDWKTGSENEDALQLQLACYALYAMDAWRTPLADIDVAGVFLRENARVSRYPLTPGALVEAKNTILSSAATMRETLVDVVGNLAEEKDFPPTEKDWPCKTCSFRAVCPKLADAT